MAKLSANRAAKEAGIAKKTLLEAINSGRLTASKNDKGHWEIDAAELFRVYPKNGYPPVLETGKKPTHTHPEKTIENNVLQAELEIMEKRFADAEKTIDDLRRRLDEEAAERRETQRVLTHMAGQDTEAERRGFWKRIFG